MREEATLNLDKLGKCIRQFQTNEAPKLQMYYNYYKGKQKILQKYSEDREYNKVVVNYCNNIVETYSGYMTGIDINYSSDNDIEAIQAILNYNDVHSEDTDFLKDALIFGRACELNYVDKLGNPRFKLLDPREVFAIYDDTLDQNLLYAVRFYRNDYVEDQTETYIVEVYDKTAVTKYKSNSGFSSFELLNQEQHFYKQVPCTFFSLNKYETSIFDQIISLQDAYNELISGEVDSWDAFADAYMVIKGMNADTDDLADMRAHRVLMVDSDASVEYLTKDLNDTQVSNMMQNINDQIHKIALSPDFNDEKFMAQSGIAMRYKLIGFENQASSIEAQMRKALQKRIELISEIAHLLTGDELWRDINITFTRNLPENVLDTANMVNQLRGLVSDETLLTQIPFITDVKAELEKLTKQKEENMSLYNFQEEVTEDEEE